MIACRCRAIPWPCMNFASASALAWISVRAASASASLIERILTASPSSCAAARKRFALLISFIARFTSAFGSISVMGEARILYPKSAIDCSSWVFMELEISSLVSKTSSSSILGTDERTTSYTYDSICPLALVRRYCAFSTDCWSGFMLYWTATLMVTNTLSLVFVSHWTCICWRRMLSVPDTNWHMHGRTTWQPGLAILLNAPQCSIVFTSPWLTMTIPARAKWRDGAMLLLCYYGRERRTKAGDVHFRGKAKGDRERCPH